MSFYNGIIICKKNIFKYLNINNNNNHLVFTFKRITVFLLINKT